MQRYYFDIIDNGIRDKDKRGTEMDSAEEAHKEAVHALLEIAKDLMPNDGKRELKLAVRNSQGETINTVTLCFDPGAVLQAKDEAQH